MTENEFTEAVKSAIRVKLADSAIGCNGSGHSICKQKAKLMVKIPNERIAMYLRSGYSVSDCVNHLICAENADPRQTSPAAMNMMFGIASKYAPLLT